MALFLYNTLSGKKEEFTPLEEGKVRMYVCGLTVQERPHIGHMRAAIVADMIQRWLEHKGFRVTQIQNFTDVDDKVIEKARSEGRDYRQIANENADEYLRACDMLGVERASFYPRASQHVQEIIALIESLFERGFAYKVDGDVYYEVAKFREYGKLSKKKLDDLWAGARVEVDERKRSPLDFALWKSAKEGEPWWGSPWGRGRPGWHIECSAMSMHYLGETFDIHTGGTDLIFPHHENEIAQSEGATGKPFARYWLHNEWVTLAGEKMSKSTGHFIPIMEILRRYAGDQLRFYLLSTHYRSQLDFDEEKLKGAESALSRITNLLDSVAEKRLKRRGRKEKPRTKKEDAFLDLLNLKYGEFEKAMDDDLNTPRAIGTVFEMVNGANIAFPELKDEEILLKTIDKVLGPCQMLGLFRGVRAEDWITDRIRVALGETFGVPPGLRVDRLMELVIGIRDSLRKEGRWELADELRSKLRDLGITLEDRPEGTIWKLT